MSKFVRFLSAHKALAFSICIIYYLLVVLPHNEVGRAVNNFFSDFSRTKYNRIVEGLFVLMIIILLAVSWKVIKKERLLGIIGSHLIVSLLSFVFCFYFLMVVSVESVHFIQYAILAFVLFPIIGHFRSTMAWGTMLGALDELYQYLILENIAFYFDFNDVVLDAVGLAMGLVILFILGIRSLAIPPTRILKRPEKFLPLGLAIVLIVAWVLGYFSINYNYNNPAFFTLYKHPIPQGFWYYPPGPPARFHILTPFPAMLIIAGLVLFYGKLDGRSVHH